MIWIFSLVKTCHSVNTCWPNEIKVDKSCYDNIVWKNKNVFTRMFPPPAHPSSLSVGTTHGVFFLEPAERYNTGLALNFCTNQASKRYSYAMPYARGKERSLFTLTALTTFITGLLWPCWPCSVKSAFQHVKSMLMETSFKPWGKELLWITCKNVTKKETV